MSIQPKTEPGSPPILSSTSNKSLETMSIPELIQILRVNWQKKDYDRVEEVLVAREEKLKTKVGQLEETFQLQSLATIVAEDKLKKKEEQYEKVQELYETLFKGVKESGLDKETVENLRKNNKELECENLKLLELKKKCEVDGNAVEELRKKVAELEAEKKKNLDTITELNDEIRDGSLPLQRNKDSHQSHGAAAGEKALRVTASSLRAFLRAKNVEREGLTSDVGGEGRVEVNQPIPQKRISIKRKRSEVDVAKEKMVDLREGKASEKEIDLQEVEKFIKNQVMLHGYRGDVDATSMWSAQFPFMLMADKYGQCPSDVKLVRDVGDVGVAQFLQVMGARLLSIGRTQELRHARDAFIDKESVDQLMRENMEKEKKLQSVLEQVGKKEEEVKGLKAQVSQLEEKEGKLEKEKTDLQTRVGELTIERKGLEENMVNELLEMFFFGFDRAVEQAKFIAPSVDFTAMDRCKIVVDGRLVDDDQEQESGDENAAAP